MALIESELGEALSPAVKRKANNTRKLRISAKRVAQGSSEVMVKVTGFGKGGEHVKAHLDYITRNGKLEMENDRGEIFCGKEEVKGLFKDWEKDFNDDKRHKNQRDTMHLVLSMPEKTDPESVRNATREFAKATFGSNYEYVFALHTDELHPHCHLTVKCLGFDGARLNPRKNDLQQWREEFADTLRDQGVDAEATPRRSRGVVKKAESNVIRHIERGDNTHKPRVSKVRALKTKEIAEELAAEEKGLPVPHKPWEAAIKSRQEKIRKAWLAAAEALEQEDTRKTFNNKEVRNERPDYSGISINHARTGQRAAAVYQSHLTKSGPKTSPGTIASLRNVSCIGMVHHEPASQVLLRENAPHRVGWQRATYSEMRRARTGHPRAFGGQGDLAHYQGTMEENKILAADIRNFVYAMPSMETERQRIKRDLVEKFKRPLEVSMDSNKDILSKPEVVRKNSLEQAANKNKDRDIDR